MFFLIFFLYFKYIYYICSDNFITIPLDNYPFEYWKNRINLQFVITSPCVFFLKKDKI